MYNRNHVDANYHMGALVGVYNVINKIADKKYMSYFVTFDYKNNPNLSKELEEEMYIKIDKIDNDKQKIIKEYILKINSALKNARKEKPNQANQRFYVSGFYSVCEELKYL